MIRKIFISLRHCQISFFNYNPRFFYRYSSLIVLLLADSLNANGRLYRAKPHDCIQICGYCYILITYLHFMIFVFIIFATFTLETFLVSYSILLSRQLLQPPKSLHYRILPAVGTVCFVHNDVHKIR